MLTMAKSVVRGEEIRLIKYPDGKYLVLIESGRRTWQERAAVECDSFSKALYLFCDTVQVCLDAKQGVKLD